MLRWGPLLAAFACRGAEGLSEYLEKAPIDVHNICNGAAPGIQETPSSINLCRAIKWVLALDEPDYCVTVFVGKIR